MENINVVFGLNIRDLRKKKGLSQEALAYMANINRNYLGCIERGENSPTLEVIWSLSRALNIDICELLLKIEKEIVQS